MTGGAVDMYPRCVSAGAGGDPMPPGQASLAISVREAQDAFELLAARRLLVPVLADPYLTGRLFPPAVDTADAEAASLAPTTCTTHELADNAGHDATLANNQRTR